MSVCLQGAEMDIKEDNVFCFKTMLFDYRYLHPNPFFNYFHITEGFVCFVFLNEVRTVVGTGIDRQKALFDAIDNL